MTIDEAIESLKSDYEIDMYIRDIAPQLAEWLEELKEYKATNYPRCSECAGCTQWNCDCANVRNKAIDDFYDKVLNFEDYIEPIDTSEFGAVLLYSGADITRMIYDIKKQLKAGGTNGNSTTDN